MTETKNVIGTLEEIKPNGNRTTLKINGKFYSGFDIKSDHLKVGDMINVEVYKSEKDDKIYWNISKFKEIEVLESDGIPPSPKEEAVVDSNDSKPDSYVEGQKRGNCLNIASRLMNEEEKKQDVFNRVKTFYSLFAEIKEQGEKLESSED